MLHHRHLESYVHNGRIGVLVEIGCESDVAPLMEEFRVLARDAALHIAAAAPPDVETLLNQPFVKDPARTVDDVVRAVSFRLKERLTITRFIRWSTDDNPPAPDGDPPRAPAVILALAGARR